MRSVVLLVLISLLSSASWASAEQVALIERLGQLMQLAKSPQRARIWVTQSDDLAPLRGAAKSALTTALGEPLACQRNDQACKSGRVLKYLFAPADRPSGQLLAVTFDAEDRVESAVWDVTR